MDATTTTTEEASPLVTIEEASRYLTLSRTTIYRKLSAGELQGVKLGNCRRIYRKSIEEYLAACTEAE